jgi:hypothetical protein
MTDRYGRKLTTGTYVISLVDDILYQIKAVDEEIVWVNKIDETQDIILTHDTSNLVIVQQDETLKN